MQLPNKFSVGGMLVPVLGLPLPRWQPFGEFDTLEEAQQQAQRQVEFYDTPLEWKRTDVDDGMTRWDSTFHHWTFSIVTGMTHATAE